MLQGQPVPLALALRRKPGDRVLAPAPCCVTSITGLQAAEAAVQGLSGAAFPFSGFSLTFSEPTGQD